MKCSYGCGNEGIYQFKNGKWCCSKSPNSCEANRSKNSKAKGGNSTFTINASNIKINCKFCNIITTKANINRHEKICFMNPNNKKLCPYCGEPIKNYKTNETCSRECSNKFFKRDYSNEDIEVECVICGTPVIVDKRAPKSKVKCNMCKINEYGKCIKCGNTLGKNNKSGLCKDCFRTPEYKEKLSNAMKERVKRGIHNSWNSRNVRSYPELFFEKVLDNNNFEYIKEYPVPKKSLGIYCNSNYFLDFFFPKKKIDLEIDGKQHLYEDRIESDNIRDKLLTEHGFFVYRINWKNINDDKGKKYIKKEIDKFIKFYNQF